jgi:hypothetical protein
MNHRVRTPQTRGASRMAAFAAEDAAAAAARVEATAALDARVRARDEFASDAAFEVLSRKRQDDKSISTGDRQTDLQNILF